LQHLQSSRDLMLAFKPNDSVLFNVTNLHQLTSQSTTSCDSCPTTWRSYDDHRLLRRHFTPCTMLLRRTVGVGSLSRSSLSM